MKKILVVVDYQNDFVKGPLGFPEAEKIEDNIYNKIKQYNDNGDDVVFTFDTHHKETYFSTQEGKNLPIMHCDYDSEGWKLFGKIASLKSDKIQIFSKYTFGSIDLAKYLFEKNYDSVEFVGVVTDICVVSNAILAKAALPEAQIIVDASCVASNQSEMEIKAFHVMRNLQIKIINEDKRL